jgi:hypothetical protein
MVRRLIIKLRAIQQVMGHILVMVHILVMGLILVMRHIRAREHMQVKEHMLVSMLPMDCTNKNISVSL